MIKYRNVATTVAIGSLAALSACSMFSGGKSSQQASYPSQSYASTAPGSYNSGGYASSSGNYAGSSGGQTGGQQELTQDTTRQVQQDLQQDGLYKGRVDGMWGPQTRSAVRSYQQQHNLNATGELDQQTLASLNVGGNEQGGQSSYNHTGGMAPQRYGNSSSAAASMNPSNAGAGNPANGSGGPTGGSASGGSNGSTSH